MSEPARDVSTYVPLREKIKAFVYHVLVGVLCGIVILALIFYGFLELADRGQIRWVFLLYLLAAILIIPGLICQHISALRKSKSQLKPKAFSAKMKLNGEIAAAMAILAFISPFLRAGWEYDDMVPDQRLHRLEAIISNSPRALPTSYCYKYPDRTLLCNRIKEDLAKIRKIIAEKHDSDVSVIVESLTNYLDQARDTLPTASFRQSQIARLASDVREWHQPDQKIVKLIQLIMPVLSVIFACFAISIKVALALEELRKEKIGAPVQPQCGCCASQKPDVIRGAFPKPP